MTLEIAGEKGGETSRVAYKICGKDTPKKPLALTRKPLSWFRSGSAAVLGPKLQWYDSAYTLIYESATTAIAKYQGSGAFNHIMGIYNQTHTDAWWVEVGVSDKIQDYGFQVIGKEALYTQLENLNVRRRPYSRS